MPEMIDPDDGLPRYYQLANILREGISNGKFSAHEPIHPSDNWRVCIPSAVRRYVRRSIY